ncbi:MAG: hypothetical protein ACPGRX_00740 [Bdellovibrionales bacterium]
MNTSDKSLTEFFFFLPHIQKQYREAYNGHERLNVIAKANKLFEDFLAANYPEKTPKRDRIWDDELTPYARLIEKYGNEPTSEEIQTINERRFSDPECS